MDAIEVEYALEDLGWFPISRRFVGSSRWVQGSHLEVRLIVYLLERASHPMNPKPGDVMETIPTIARHNGVSEAEATEAMNKLLGPDEYSQSQEAEGAFIVPLTREGRIVGYRVVNFHKFNPYAQEKADLAKKRRALARSAAMKRWHPESYCSTKKCTNQGLITYAGKTWCEECAKKEGIEC